MLMLEQQRADERIVVSSDHTHTHPAVDVDRAAGTERGRGTGEPLEVVCSTIWIDDDVSGKVIDGSGRVGHCGV